MREVEVSRFIRTSVPEVERLLTPDLLVEYEGSFRVREVSELEDGTRVIVGARGLEMSLFFEERSDGGWMYYQEGDAGPLAAMETMVTYRPENDGVRVTMRSGVSLGLFPAWLSDRIAAWKRRGELDRALRKLAEDLE